MSEEKREKKKFHCVYASNFVTKRNQKALENTINVENGSFHGWEKENFEQPQFLAYIKKFFIEIFFLLTFTNTHTHKMRKIPKGIQLKASRIPSFLDFSLFSAILHTHSFTLSKAFKIFSSSHIRTHKIVCVCAFAM